MFFEGILYPLNNLGLLILYILVHTFDYRYFIFLCIKLKYRQLKKACAISASPLLGLCSLVRQLFKIERLYCLFLIVTIFKTWLFFKKKKTENKATAFNWSVCSLETQQILFCLYLDLSIYLDSLSRRAQWFALWKHVLFC